MKRNHNSTIISLTAASFFALAASANASDLLDSLNDPAPTQGVTVNWSGVYVGGRAGVGNANHDLTAEAYDSNGPDNLPEHQGILVIDGNDLDNVAGPINVLGLNGINSLGLMGGGQIGADKQMGNFVVGVFGTYDFSNMETEFTLFDETEVIASKEYEWSAGGRFGYLVNPETLLYGLVAYTETEYDLTGDDSHKFDGVTVGGGIEFAATRNVFFGLEATHTFYGKETLSDDPEGYELPFVDGYSDGLRVFDDLDETKIMGTLKIKLNSF